MEIRILGSLFAQHDMRDATPTARKPRQVLSLLVLNGNEVVPTTHLMQELWNMSPPRSASTTLQTYILGLRKRIAAALDVPVADVSREVLRTVSSGYLLDLQYAAVDLDKYLRLEQTGMNAYTSHNNLGAVVSFDNALALWRGPVLANVEHGPLLEIEVARIEQSKLTVMECRLETKLRLGRHRETLSELAALILQYRYNENLHAQHMVALHRSGYRYRALEIYQQLRTSMIEDLGVEPSPRLGRLQCAVLASDPQLDDLTDTQWSAMDTVQRDASRCG